jgi:hypothetical protein
MASSDERLQRPEFESVDLATDVAETRRHVETAIKGLAVSETDEAVNYRTRAGTLVAVLGPTGDGATLAYRTAPASDPATRKASRLVAALDPHVVD